MSLPTYGNLTENTGALIVLPNVIWLGATEIYLLYVSVLFFLNYYSNILWQAKNSWWNFWFDLFI